MEYKIKYDKLLAGFQDEMGCTNCKFADKTKIGFIDACTHPLGWRSAFSSMRCVRCVKIVDKDK